MGLKIIFLRRPQALLGKKFRQVPRGFDRKRDWGRNHCHRKILLPAAYHAKPFNSFKVPLLTTNAISKASCGPLPPSTKRKNKPSPPYPALRFSWHGFREKSETINYFKEIREEFFLVRDTTASPMDPIIEYRKKLGGEENYPTPTFQSLFSQATGLAVPSPQAEEKVSGIGGRFLIPVRICLRIVRYHPPPDSFPAAPR